jgi:hypothetical protein
VQFLQSIDALFDGLRPVNRSIFFSDAADERGGSWGRLQVKQGGKRILAKTIVLILEETDN